MGISWDRIAAWVTLIALGFALGVGFLALRQTGQPEAIEIATAQPTAQPSAQPTADLQATPTIAASHVRVYVTGAVQESAVYELAPDSIIDDAIRAAGGFSADANITSVNLAQPVFDGMQITVPELTEEVVEPPVVSGGSTDSTGDAPVRLSPDLFAGLVNVNEASAAELEALPGIGPSLAANILAYREANGPFLDVESLMDVPGIGEAKLEAIRDLIAIGP